MSTKYPAPPREERATCPRCTARAVVLTSSVSGEKWFASHLRWMGDHAAPEYCDGVPARQEAA